MFDKSVLLAIRNARPQDPITRVGTLIEQRAGFPVIIKAIQAGPGLPLKTIVTPLPLKSPLDVSHYEKDLATQTIFPVFNREKVAGAGSYLEISQNPRQFFPSDISGLSDPYWGDDGMDGYQSADLSGLMDVLGSGWTAVKAFVEHPIQTIKTSVAVAKQNRENAAYIKAGSNPYAPTAAPKPGFISAIASSVAGTLLPGLFGQKQPTGAGQEGASGPGGQQTVVNQQAQGLQALINTLPNGQLKDAAQAELDAGDFNTCARTIMAAGGHVSPELAGSSAMPSWLLPVGIGVAALFVLKGTGKGKGRQ